MLVYIGQIGDDTPIKEYSNGMLPPSSFGGKLFAGGGRGQNFLFWLGGVELLWGSFLRGDRFWNVEGKFKFA